MEDRRGFEAPAETRREAAERHYAAAVVRWDVVEMAAWLEELEALDREAVYETIYNDGEVAA